MPKFEDILFTELETEDIKDVNLAEGIFPMNPLLAFYTFKRNSLKNLKNIKGATIGKVKEKGKKTKAELKKGGEKLRSTLDSGGGKDPDATVYRLTRKQEEVMSRLHEKHGPKFIQELMDFRTGVLAPYQVIKRTVKKNKMLTSKETLGMTKEQFKSSIESGRRKIEARGSRFEKFDDLEASIDKQKRTIEALEKVKAGIKTNKQIPPTILERILKEFELGKKEFESYSMNDLKKAYFEITKNTEKMGEIGADDEGDALKKGKDINILVQRNIDLRKGRVAKQDVAKRMELKRAEVSGDDDLKEDYLYEYKIDLTKNKNFRMSNGGFNSALGLYFLRKEIIKQLKPENRDSLYRQTYVRIVDQLIDDAKTRKSSAGAKVIKGKGAVEFNERERKIWELRPSVKTQSGDVKDYVQKLKEEDFFNPKYFKKSEKLTAAEKKVEAGIKKFERSLKKRISPEEYAELKKYRLINNLITVGEMKSPDKLFKSQEELQADVKTVKREFLSDGEFNRKMREILSTEYDSISDLNKAKKEAQELMDTKKDQGDEDVADEMSGILTKIKNRKGIKPGKVVGGELEMTDDDLIDAGLIEKTIKSMLKKDYEDDDELKRDQIRIKSMVKKYKEEGGADADRNMEEIDFLFKKLSRKTGTSPTIADDGDN